MSDNNPAIVSHEELDVALAKLEESFTATIDGLQKRLAELNAVTVEDLKNATEPLSEAIARVQSEVALLSAPTRDALYELDDTHLKAWMARVLEKYFTSDKPPVPVAPNEPFITG